jgi:alkylation response protein AidB-like acyl-CoA dehydrogenase
VHENRIRQAAASLGAGQYCINEAVRYANARITWGKKLSTNQAIQFPLIELHTDAAALRLLVRATAAELDKRNHMEVTHLVAMCNYRANRLACDAADRAMQTCGGVGYSRHMPFEHIYRHHRRYRITEGSEEIQMRKVGQHLFGFTRT